ncbi:hypothetical protein AJ87_11175 [Rhizobium yanglingense]|nr:hypothetical protein AJ87_11175 [Rhizobium yanglingense]
MQALLHMRHSELKRARAYLVVDIETVLAQNALVIALVDAIVAVPAQKPQKISLRKRPYFKLLMNLASIHLRPGLPVMLSLQRRLFRCVWLSISASIIPDVFLKAFGKRGKLTLRMIAIHAVDGCVARLVI